MRKFAKSPLFILLAAILILPLWLQVAGAPQVKPPATTKTPTASFCVLYDFGTRPADPLYQTQPATIADGHDGFLYSTSSQGGTHGYGTVFRISPVDGNPPSVIYNFDGVHGIAPQGGLTRGSDGAFYGATYQGGKYGVGTVFKITSAGAVTVLWDFRNGTVIPVPVGRLPTAQEKLDAAGAYPISAPVMVGTTLYGVATYAGNLPWGVVYQISGGTYHGLYQFTPADAAANGAFPTSLSVGPTGKIWGVTARGGVGFGTVFQLQGGAISTVYKFVVAQQGSQGVIEGRDGMLYGNATGPNTSLGMVFRLNPGTHEALVLHSFSGNDGAVPVAELIQAQSGVLYGVTKGGGSDGRGVVFSLNTDGSNFATLFNMDMNDGRYAMSPLLEYSKDNFYGVTDQGGVHDQGVFYHVSAFLYPTPAHDSLYVGGTIAATGLNAIVKKDVNASQVDASGVAVLLAADGINVTVPCSRDPHVVQFVYRMQIGADGTPASGPFSTSWGTFKFTEKADTPIWHTDAIGYPNPFYDQAPGSSHVVKTTYASILDAPQPITDNASWLVTAKDFCICNCKVVNVVHWTRQGNFNLTTGTLGPSQYSNISVEAPPATDTGYTWSNTQMKWINAQLATDGYNTILPY